ncbi:hypothetical protein A3SI_19902 [Nitritalea halalkaliphila LW7]|uniref:Uncharacterized protein n=1 Tax=Nitritalea halalkaliphila LW7 TaxID=1189621 RepID=I5BRT2_9BACT|nr:hypothetical protein A3SI_19902 [Nitritalea halalkaliphila LW7]
MSGAQRNGLRTLAKLREPPCEWSKGGARESLTKEGGLQLCGSEGLAWFFAFFAKTMTARSAPHKGYLPAGGNH